MDIYIKNEKENNTFQFPVNPLDEINFSRSKNFDTVDIVEVGEVDIAIKGKKIREISFETLLPATYNSFCRYSNIPNPKEVIELLEKWIDQEEPVRLIITDYDFNDLVIISEFDDTGKSGEVGDRYISITFRTYKELKIEEINTTQQTVKPSNATTTTNNNTVKRMVVNVGNSRLNVRSGPSTSDTIIGKLNNSVEVEIIELQNGWAKIKYSTGKDGIGYVSATYLKEKPSSPSLNERSNTQAKSNTHTVASGDTLYKISKKVYGDGSKWNKIYEANKQIIGNNPDVIKVGQKLVIP